MNRLSRQKGGVQALKTWMSRLLALGCVLVLTGCAARGAPPAETKLFAMDTIMSLSIYGSKAQEALDRAVDTLYTLDADLSATHPNSPIFELNDAKGDWVSLPEEAFLLLEEALALCEQTGGALDLTAYAAVKAWGFTDGSYRVPTEEERLALADRIDYAAVELDPARHAARLPEHIVLDLGSVGKGWAGDLLSAQLREAGVSSALLDLGQSSIQAVGRKPNGTPWRIGIQDPAGDGYLGVLELEDRAMGTSGGYQRSFTQQGETYWHIMDPKTAAPARSGLASVTVVADSGLLCDGLSTALFVMGEEGAMDFRAEHPQLEFEVIFIDEAGKIAITQGLEEHFSLAKGYEDRTLEVLP